MDFQEIIDSIKNWWSSLGIEQKILGDASYDAVQVSIFFVTFFAIGFLFKKYLRFIFMSLLITFLVIKGLEYYKLVHVDWGSLKSMAGFDPAATLEMMYTKVSTWIRTNMIVFLSSFVGFVVGYKLG